MAHSFSKTERIFFETVIEGFDPNNITVKNVNQYKPSAQAVERSGLTVRRPYPYQVNNATGLDVSSSYKDLTELTCPVSLAASDIKNVPFTLSAFERNDERRLREAAVAATQDLSSQVDTDVQNTIATRGSIVTAETGNFDTYLKLSKGDTALMEREVQQSTSRSLVLNPRAANAMASDIAGRNNLDGRPLTTYERATLPPVAAFNTLRANVIQNISGSASSGVTVNGASQSVTPVAFDSTGTLAAGTVDDPRYSVLTVSAAHGLVAGDCFTLAGVNSIGAISKKDTGQLQTFRVISVSTNDLTISPAIIPADGTDAQVRYATVTTTPANGAAVTVVNTDDTQPSIFFTRPSVEVFVGELETSELAQSMAVMSETTDSGISIIFARQGSIDDLSAKYRLTCWTKAHVLQPQHCGIMLPNQNAAVG
ncbi:MAG: P22 phage major capsid protein family protein [Candidatus Thiodiazotropha sp.]